MKTSNRAILYAFAFLSFTTPIFLGGCAAAQVAVEASREAAKDVRLTKSRHYSSDLVENYSTIAVLVRGVGEGSGGQAFSFAGLGATGGSSAEVLEARVAGVLTRAGFDIIEKGDVEEFATERELERPSERVIVKLAGKAGAQGVIVGIAEAGSATKIGFFGVGAGQEKGLVNASFKLVDTASKKTLAILSVDYKEPKTANEIMDLLEPHFQSLMAGTAQDIDGGSQGGLKEALTEPFQN